MTSSQLSSPLFTAKLALSLRLLLPQRYSDPVKNKELRWKLSWKLAGCLYLLDLPCVKFWTMATCDLVIAVLATVTRYEVLAQPNVLAFAQLWTASGIAWEVRQMVIAGCSEHVDGKHHFLINWAKHIVGGARVRSPAIELTVCALTSAAGAHMKVSYRFAGGHRSTGPTVSIVMTFLPC